MSIPPEKSTGLSLSPSPPEELQMFSCSYPNCGYKDKREVIVAIHESHHKLSFKRDFPCQLCPEIFPALVSFLHHMSTHHAYNLFCPFCPFRAADWTGFNPHIFTHSLTVAYVPKARERFGNALHCAICSEIFASRESLSEHLKECSRKLEPLRPSVKKIETRNSHESSQRQKQTEKSACFQTEEISNSSSSSSSSSTEVKGSFARSKNFLINVKIVHRCAICSNVFTSRESLLQHLKKCCRKLNPKRTKANNLGESQISFDRSKRTEESGRYHETSNSGSCSSSIIMEAGDWTELKPHILTHSSSVYVPKSGKSVEDETILRCAICSITFTSKESLSEHLKTCCRKLKPLPWSSKGVVADNLDKSQESFVHLKQTDESSRSHAQTQDPDPFNPIAQILDSSKAHILKSSCANWTKRRLELSCVRCSRTFTSRRYLTLHRKNNSCRPISRRSSSANSFRCSNCSLNFKHKSSLRYHEKTSCNYSNYVGEEDGVEKVVGIQRTAFACHNCSFTTVHAKAMRRHYRVHTGERPFQCPNLGCGYRARWVGNLRSHQLACRGIESTTTIMKTEDKLGSDTECGDKDQVNGEDRRSVTFACMICNFVADSELSALKHSCQHKTVVVLLNRI